MGGLIKKDFLLIKNNIKFFLIYILFFLVLSFTEASLNITFVLPFMAIMMFITTFSYDDFNNFNAYAITLPVGRKNIVKGKYLTAGIIIAVSFILSLILPFLSDVISNNRFNFIDVLANVSGTILGLVLIISIWLPMLYKFGVEKGRIMLFVLVFGISIIGAVLARFIDFTPVINFINSLDNIFFIVIPFLSVVSLIVSYLISTKIFLKKDF